MMDNVPENSLPLTRAQKVAATKAEKQRLEQEAMPQRFAEEQCLDDYFVVTPEVAS